MSSLNITGRGRGALGGFAALALLLWAAAALAQVNLPDSPVRVYQVRMQEPAEGSLKLSSEVERVKEIRNRLYRTVQAGQPVYIFEREDRTDDGDQISWSFTLSPDRLGLLRVEKKIRSHSGQQVVDSWYDYRDPMFSFPKNTCFLYTIVPALEAMRLEPGAQNDIYVLLSLDQTPWHMFVVVEARETITVPAGTFPCLRVRLEPDYKQIMGRWSWAASVVKPLVPDYIFWVEEAPPHYLIRFEGKYGPVGATPTQTHELTAILPPPGGSL